MSSDTAVAFEDVTKSYKVRSGQAAVRDVLRPSRRETRHALQDLNLTIEAGESVGFIGPNGAGKTTALRMISRITRPTRGRVAVHGSVGALLEVGSGIHPELTARENIWMYGNILGMRRAQIRPRFDSIVEFAELGHVLDQQVKFFSSGMQLRLGFAIAAHLEPDILIVDEALAVGDMRFQRRCIDHMSSLARSDATIIYVSHQLGTVEAICNRVFWLDQGHLRETGPPREVMGRYLDSIEPDAVAISSLDQEHNRIRIVGCEVSDQHHVPTASIASGEGLRLMLEFEGEPTSEPMVAVGITPGGPDSLIACSMLEHGTVIEHVGTQWTCELDITSVPLRPGAYELWCSILAQDAHTPLLHWGRISNLQIVGALGAGPRALTEEGAVVVPHQFRVHQ